MHTLDHLFARLGRRASRRLRGTGDAPPDLPESTTTNVLRAEAPPAPYRARSSIDDLPQIPGRMAKTKPTSTAPNPNAFDPNAFRSSAPAPRAPAPAASQWIPPPTNDEADPDAYQAPKVRRAAQVPAAASQWIPPPTEDEPDPDIYQAAKVPRAPRTAPPRAPAAPAPYSAEPPRGPWIPPPTEDAPQGLLDRLKALFRSPV